MSEQRMTEAAGWLLRLRDPGASQSDLAEWLAWCKHSPENQRAFENMQALWAASGDMQEKSIDPRELAADSYAGQVSVAEWKSRKSRRWQPSWLPAVAAAAAVVCFATGLPWALKHSGALLKSNVLATVSTGVNRDVNLPDGSKVTVAPGSRLVERYSARERRLDLENGEAFFQVHGDRNRPFTVHVLDTTITAIGTAFNIRADGGVVRVSVTEGAVNVDRSSRPERISLAAGHRVTLDPNGSAPIVAVNTVQATSWVSGILQFADEPLPSVIAAVNRYSSVPLRVRDPSLAQYRYTGTVVAGHVSEWLSALPNVFPVVLSNEDPHSIYIESAGSDAPR